MAIQWFPGHMHLTRKAIGERIKDIDVVIELLDARLPASSANPMLAELTGHKPGVKVLNKQDVADPARTARWLAHYNALAETRAIGLDASQTNAVQQLVGACHALAPLRGGMAKPMRVLICGIPNVGKSTLVNTLAGGRKKAKTGDEAGITRLEQRITLADDFYLWDTPGMLWPRILAAKAGYNLAASGAIGRNAYDEEEVALELLDVLKRSYADALARRFGLEGDAAAIAAMKDEEILEAIGRKRGALLGKGRVNLQKAAELTMQAFRDGSLGGVTLETPEEFADWMEEGRRLDEARAAKKAARGRKAPAPTVDD